MLTATKILVETAFTMGRRALGSKKVREQPTKWPALEMKRKPTIFLTYEEK